MTLSFYIGAALFFLAVWILFSIIFWSIRNGISPMPTSSKAKKCLLDLLPTHPPGPIFELGSGWGSLAFPLAKLYPNIVVTAYETSPIPYFFSKFRQILTPLPNLKIVRQDFFNVPLPPDALVVCYLYPGAMRRLKPKFEAELSYKSLIISNTFGIPGWNPVKTVVVPDLYLTKIYVYKTKRIDHLQT